MPATSQNKEKFKDYEAFLAVEHDKAEREKAERFPLSPREENNISKLTD